MREIRQSGSEGGEITKVIFPTPIRHPITGAILIPKDKIITRSLMQLFKNLTEEVNKVSQ